MASSRAGVLLPRDDTGKQFLDLMSNPFNTQVTQDSVVIAILTALGISLAVFLVFLFLRPFNSTVYAPKLRHSDEKRKPPPIGKGLFAWVPPVFHYNESQYVDKIGLDAAVFLRFARMCRNMFIVLSVFGCAVIIPVNVTASKSLQSKFEFKRLDPFFLMTPQSLFGNKLWVMIFIAYLFTFVVCGFLWWTYRAVHRLRRNYLESPEYQNSLHSRTLMITDIKRSQRSDHGIIEITDSLRTTPEVPRASIGRNVKDLPDLIEEHKEAVIELEGVLSKYLKRPDRLPPSRPMCKPSKKDPEYLGVKTKVDAIDYLTARIQGLEAQIKAVRETVDKRDAMPYGFASYETLESAHSVAFAARGKHPLGTTVQLAPRPSNIIWKNLPLDPKTRRWRHITTQFWITLLTMLYFIPNAMIAIFLAKLDNIATLAPSFRVTMQESPKFWALVQGIAAPALTSLFYYFLPIIFRRLSIKSGDLTKTSRERHVIHQLYAFFVFNNLFVFSLLGAVFSFVIQVVAQSKDKNKSFLVVVREAKPFQMIVMTLSEFSPYWVTWLAQRNLGAAIDLSQAVNLAWGSFSRKFLNPTPRELIQRTAPPPFDYASYYNYFLFYSTVALCFATLQPLTLVVTAVYFTIDASMKKYLLLYVFATKNESGGQFWRVLFNRLLVASFLSNVIVALTVYVRTDNYPYRWHMIGAMVPLAVILIGFKLYCRHTFDASMRYYTKGESPKGAEAPAPIDKEARRRDRVAVRFGNPALYQKLIVPMVHEKSKHLLAEIYKGRLDGDIGGSGGYSDVYAMKRMSKDQPGKVAAPTGPFEFVSEDNMDYENFKNRPEFAEHGGDAASISRPDTPASMFGQDRGRSQSRDSERALMGGEETGVTYPAGYHSTPSALREYSPSPDRGTRTMDSTSSQPYQIRDDRGLLGGAAPMGSHSPATYTPYSPEQQDGRTDYFRR